MYADIHNICLTYTPAHAWCSTTPVNACILSAKNAYGLVYIHIYIYIHMYIYIYIHSYIDIYIHTYTYTYIYAWIYNICTYANICIYTYMYIYMHMLTCIYISPQLVHARLRNGAAASLSWKLLRTYLKSCANIVQAVVSAHPPAPSSSRPPSCWPVARHVRLRNPIKSTLAHDAVAAFSRAFCAFMSYTSP